MAGIYIHIPFCKTRCIYCDFYSTTQSEKTDRYIDALCKELEIRKDYLENEDIETIYFGGGTPSQLNKRHFEKVFDAINKLYRVKKEAEITIEANPDDLSKDYIKSLTELPFNRISMGVQTFNDDILKIIRRRHNSQQAIDAFYNCREAGFKNISLDLMYGLIGESIESWENDLNKIIKLHPEHISAYHLIYEEGTALWKLREQHKVKEVNEDLSLDMFTLLINKLSEGGYEHYEISNFALPGLYSKHNSSYWRNKKYMGCGPSAHSYNLQTRQWNISSLDKYIEEINNSGQFFEIEELDLYTHYNDFIITALRTKWGVDLNLLKKSFGDTLYNYALKMSSQHIKEGTLERDGDIIKLTKKGIFISDGIMSDMLWV